MSENTKSKMTEKKEQRKRLEQQIRFIIEADKVKKRFSADISCRPEAGKKTMRNIHGIWHCLRYF